MQKAKENKENKPITAAYSLLYSINHIFLPPKPPEEDDTDIMEDLALTEEFRAALESFMAPLPPEDRLEWASSKMLSRMLETRDPCGDMIVENVKMSLGQMTSGGRPDLDRATDYAHSYRYPSIPYSRSECWPHYSCNTPTLRVRVV